MLGLQPKDVRGMLFEDALVHKHNRMLKLAARAMGADAHSYSNLNSHLDPKPSLIADLDSHTKCDPAALQILVAQAVGQRVDLERKIMHENHSKTLYRTSGVGGVSSFSDDQISKYTFQQHHQTMISTLQRYECMVADSIGDLVLTRSNHE